ncbi:lytic transglycosylase domain-containing protein [Aliiroseovarius sp. YM-037]|uniref:lytic transglycosylase domain-containing protein n=1 Tax=Aliiroseovarius sp. YM-037 TaxID=3341728 RepID=UPI003A7F709A
MRVLSIVLLLLSLAASASAAQDTPLARAMKHVRADEWSAAIAAARPAGQVALDVVEWRRLRAGIGQFSDYQAFLARNGDWPGLKALRKRGEGSITGAVSATEVLEYFAEQPPQTGDGAYQRVRAFRQTGLEGDAMAEAVKSWRTLSIGRNARANFLEAYGSLLQPHHQARLDMLLWRGLTDEATAMLPRVSEGWRKLAAARIALRQSKGGVDDLIAAVPPSLRDNPGLAYERFLWRLRKGFEGSALEMMEARSGSAEDLGEPNLWGGWRRVFARQLMRDGEAARAYRLASSHHIAEGRNHADLEWLSGYIALRKLDDPETALQHFRRFRAAVFTPISLGRAGYWEGRAQEALGNDEGARAAYAFGAEYQTSFYGLLAAERGGLPMDMDLTGDGLVEDWREADFMQSSVMQAALMFHEAGERNLAERFMVHLAETQDERSLRLMGDLALSLDEPHLALMIAKQAAQQGYALPRAYYPLHPLVDEDLPVPTELVLSIARRESEFDFVVVSPAGARGMMQVMPGTAKDVARELELAYDGNRLLNDWKYNVRLGSSYLEGLIDEFGPSYVLVAAGYNAGPSRPRRWIQRFGDPRSAGVDVVDWIEHIPFSETRNYVMRVMESIPVYRARLTGETAPLRLSKELRRSPS